MHGLPNLKKKTPNVVTLQILVIQSLYVSIARKMYNITIAHPVYSFTNHLYPQVSVFHLRSFWNLNNILPDTVVLWCIIIYFRTKLHVFII